jgi:16S rRNA processing protein RimM
MQRDPERRIVVGRVAGVYGVQGWVKLRSYTDPMEGLLAFETVQLGRADAWRPARIAEGRPHGRGLIGRFDGCEDRDAAALLVGSEIAVARSQLAPVGPDEVYWADLVGLVVENEAGETLGRVERLIETGAHDVLVVQGERERLIPFVRGEIVTDIDLERGRLRVAWEADY